MKQHIMKFYGRVKVGYTANIFKFGPGWRWVISLTARTICLWRKSPWFSWYGAGRVPQPAIPGILSRFAGWPIRISYDNFTCIYNLFMLVIMAVTIHSMHSLHSVSNHHSCLVFLRTVSFQSRTYFWTSLPSTPRV